MRAAVIHTYGQAPVLQGFREPAGDGVVLDVLATGLNPIDIRLATGTVPASPLAPYVAGLECVGRTPDDRVAYARTSVAPFGGLADRTLVDPSELVELPEGLDPAHAVCFGVAGLAGYFAVHDKGQVARGDRVLVLGASGTVGLVAIQLAKLAGAGRVVAAGRSQAGLRRAAELGADATVTLDDDQQTLTDVFRTAAGGDLDVVIDPLWGAPAAAALDALRVGGTLVNVGQSAAAELRLSSATVRFGEVQIRGHTNFAAPAQVQDSALRRLWKHALAGELMVDHETVALDDIEASWARQAAGPGTKLVVVP